MAAVSLVRSSWERVETFFVWCLFEMIDCKRSNMDVLFSALVVCRVH